MRLVASLGALSLMSSAVFAADADTLKPYAPAEEGFVRYVIELPEAEQENNLKVEIIAGKTLEVDCNKQRLGGELQQRTIEGWGYPAYYLETVTGPMTTLMACPDSKKEAQFVPVSGEGFVIGYNSRLPVVVYAPEGIEVKYRLWKAEDVVGSAEAR